MNAEISTPGWTAESLAPTGHFTIRLSATPRGARLARRLATQQLADWGWGYATEASGTVALLVAELTANAVRHGRVRGRDFRMSLTLHAADPALRIEVTDARPDRCPPTPGTLPQSPPEAESGRGLLLVEALSTHWGVTNGDPYTKTVWCEVLLN
ncbi:ATP-binding protein [Streptomyces sp. NPDC093260]|uniref:ATP-binding protein n=1 Tax=Streptomyces sp. NPDC093260 TaxID=3155073 RepID=UPI00343E9867